MSDTALLIIDMQVGNFSEPVISLSNSSFFVFFFVVFIFVFSVVSLSAGFPTCLLSFLLR
jgi:hypothetical protein